jgi:hypothetical protein
MRCPARSYSTCSWCSLLLLGGIAEGGAEAIAGGRGSGLGERARCGYKASWADCAPRADGACLPSPPPRTRHPRGCTCAQNRLPGLALAAGAPQPLQSTALPPRSSWKPCRARSRALSTIPGPPLLAATARRAPPLCARRGMPPAMAGRSPQPAAWVSAGFKNRVPEPPSPDSGPDSPQTGYLRFLLDQYLQRKASARLAASCAVSALRCRCRPSTRSPAAGVRHQQHAAEAAQARVRRRWGPRAQRDRRAARWRHGGATAPLPLLQALHPHAARRSSWPQRPRG